MISKKQARPGRINYVKDVRWTCDGHGGGGGGGAAVNSAGTWICSLSNRVGLRASRLVHALDKSLM